MDTDTQERPRLSVSICVHLWLFPSFQSTYTNSFAFISEWQKSVMAAARDGSRNLGKPRGKSSGRTGERSDSISERCCAMKRSAAEISSSVASRLNARRQADG